MINDNRRKYNFLRQEYNVFTYERFDYVLTNDKINIKYTFNLSDKHTFEPELILHLNTKSQSIPEISILDNLIFHIGMIELISYWKAACPPKIVICPYFMDEDQIYFWKKIYFHGLGEFFYVNGVEADLEDFVEIVTESKNKAAPKPMALDQKRVLVPIGGGKDSIVSLELLKKHVEVIPFIINPRKASTESAGIAGFIPEDIFRVDRVIHPKLLELNSAGFLNGHTPFSAVVGFISILAATLTNSRFIALSNESSANEPTVVDGPNHQYSKSYGFESDFRNYVHRYISPDLQYFSFLRPLSEIEIAEIFSRYPKYFKAFKSCNVGSKLDVWCGQCPKCLFTAIILSPFIDREEIIKIFNGDILDRQELIPIFDSLIGANPVKPFECVGTLDEVNKALALTIMKSQGDLPALLRYYMQTTQYKRYEEKSVPDPVEAKSEHFLEKPFIDILNNGVSEL